MQMRFGFRHCAGPWGSQFDTTTVTVVAGVSPAGSGGVSPPVSNQLNSKRPTAKIAELLTRLTKTNQYSSLKTVNARDAKNHFLSLLAAVENNGESFVVCRNGEPVADLVPHKPRNRIKPNHRLSQIKAKYDPLETASEEEWPKRFRCH